MENKPFCEKKLDSLLKGSPIVIFLQTAGCFSGLLLTDLQQLRLLEIAYYFCK